MPPRDPRPFIKLVKIAPGPEVVYRILSDSLIGFMTHYISERTVVCPGYDQGCKHCLTGLDPRWSGYLAVSALNYPTTYLFPISPAAAQNCPALASLDGQLRGKLIGGKRLGKVKTSPLQVIVYEPPPNAKQPASLPVVDVREALARLWGTRAVCPQNTPPQELIPVP